HAAFAEPVAAALAVPTMLADTGVAPASRGLILGQGRIAALTARVLASAGRGLVPIWPVPDRVDEHDVFDFVVETTASEGALAAALALLRPRGTLVLKSRPPRPVALDVAGCVRKELRLTGAYYS